jgi:hypothetical protein
MDSGSFGLMGTHSLTVPPNYLLKTLEGIPGVENVRMYARNKITILQDSKWLMQHWLEIGHMMIWFGLGRTAMGSGSLPTKRRHLLKRSCR